jgi:phage terminase large subunit
MATARIELIPKLVPVFAGPADVRWACGGRGSGKTRSFALMMAVKGYAFGKEGRSGLLLGCRQWMNSLADSSFHEISSAIREHAWLADYYELGEKYIRSKDGRIDFAFSGLERNISSIKGKSRILIAWIDEADVVSEQALMTLEPTIREDGAELWATWNPLNKRCPVEDRYRYSKDPLVKGAEVNWRDNPRFPARLQRQRERDELERPDSYGHIWEGEYAKAVEGAYFASYLQKAKKDGRIGRVAADPLLTLRAFVDIGGTGAKADSFAMWIVQFVGREIRVLDYYEAQGQPLATHLGWLRERDYTPRRLQIWLPHDGASHDKVFDVSYESALKEAGYKVTVVPNQGRGAAKQRIEAVRRHMGLCWFNEDTTEPGREALAWYHEKMDKERNIGLGPDHDWSSHGCFHGETVVLTRYGSHRIMDLPETGEVLTPCGWKQYILPRITKRNARLVEVVFTGGYSVKCTPDHLFLTVSGWKSAESLQKGSLIQSCSMGSSSISGAVCTVFGRAIATIQRAAAGFIEMCGRPHLGTFRRRATSTTGMEMSLTTGSKTLSALTLQNTCASPGSWDPCTAEAFSAKRQGEPLQSGMDLQRVGSGIGDMLSARKAGQSGSASPASVCTALLSSARWSAKVAIRRFIAALRAKLPRTGSAGSPMSTPLRIERVKQISLRADVWDITVPDGRCFSIENGAVVHNSDAYGLMACVYEAPDERKAEPLKYKSLRRLA